MNTEQLSQYLQRIGVEGELPTTIETVERMQRAHLENVPFENLDIMAKCEPLKLSEEELFDKIVNRRFGGICYELNFLFAQALTDLGFTVHFLAARAKPTGTEFDHVTLLVEDPEDPSADPWLTDVGYAWNFACPLQFTMGKVQNDGRLDYFFQKVEVDGETWYQLMRIIDGKEELAFEFRYIFHEHEDYYPRAEFYATDPTSFFRQGPLVCIDGEDARLTLSGHRYIVTKDGVRTEREIEYPREFNEMLSTVFKMNV